MSVERKAWGTFEGQEVSLYTLCNSAGMTVKVSDYGATLVDVQTPDRNGNVASVVLGFDSLQRYLDNHPNFGSTIGRYAGRICGASFALDDTLYQLKANRNGSIIHGGAKGFNRQLFRVENAYTTNDTAAVRLSYTSPDGEEGFPGTLRFCLTYKLTDRNEVILEYEATTDKPTVVNFTNHSYFNLNGCTAPVLNHRLVVDADSLCVTDAHGIPNGEFKAVCNTPYDFRQCSNIGDSIGNLPKGYDICYKLNTDRPEGLTQVADVSDPATGRTLKAYTSEPGMQLFVGLIDLGNFVGHGGTRYGKCYGLCLEMQHFPDSPNQQHFPSTVLRPGETYRQTTIYTFGVLNT